MAIEVVFDQSVDGRPPVRFGPFSEILMTHRRLHGDDLEVVRHFDGGWHVGDGSFLELRIRPVASEIDRLIRIDFTRPWSTPARAESALAIRLYGDRLLAGKEDRWVASNDDEARCWVSEANGLACAQLILTTS